MVALFGCQPFASALVMSTPDWFRYDWVWDKKIPAGMCHARFRPMRQHESVLMFCETNCGNNTTYNAQMTLRDKPIVSGGMSGGEATNCGGFKPLGKISTHKNPTTIVTFAKVRRGGVHPTQKPVALMEYLIKTYTNEGETVLDFTMGSGTTGVACMNTNRRFIGIEKDEKYFQIAKQRIETAFGTVACDKS
jgi:site-specific DNA-methyltransferase (adenine-specific)